MTCQEGKGLNIRPIEPELREALRALAKAEGLRLYEYVLEPPVPARREPYVHTRSADVLA